MYLDSRLTLLAILPGLVIIYIVYTKDKVEKEPVGMIVRLLIFGALSCIPAVAMETFMTNILPQYPEGSFPYAFTTAFFVAALCEEIVKYCALRLGSWKSPYFNYRFDGIVYGVSAAVGFALLENVEYVAMYGVQTAIVRAVLAVPLHAFCGLFMGLFYAYSKRAQIIGKNGVKAWCTFLALIIPMCIHGIYDTLAMMRSEGAEMVLLGFVVVLYIVSIRTMNKMSKEDYKAGFYPQARVIDYDV